MSTDSYKPSKEQSATRRVPWSPILAVIFLVVTIIGLQIFAGLALSIYPALRGWNHVEADNWLSNSVLAQFIFSALTDGLIVGAIYLFVRHFKASLKVLGLLRPRYGDLGWALWVGIIYFFALVVAVSALSHYVPGFNPNQQQQIGFNNAQGFAQLALTFISLAVIPPLAEEIMFRGFLYTSLRRSLPILWAALFTSALFALPHLLEGGSGGLLWIGALDTFILSLFLVYLREKTGRLMPGIWLHAFKNTIAFVSLFALHFR